MARQNKGTPTSLNLWVLAKLMNGATSCPNRFEAVDAPHLRRCLKAGLLTIEGERGTAGTLVLTPAGVDALKTVKL